MQAILDQSKYCFPLPSALSGWQVEYAYFNPALRSALIMSASPEILQTLRCLKTSNEKLGRDGNNFFAPILRFRHAT